MILLFTSQRNSQDHLYKGLTTYPFSILSALIYILMIIYFNGKD